MCPNLQKQTAFKNTQVQEWKTVVVGEEEKRSTGDV